MIRKVLVVAGASLLATSVLTSVPATAAAKKVSNGVACSKAGATTKVKSTTYRCAKNVLVKNSRLTWLSTNCISSAKAYRTALANLPKVKKSTDEIVVTLDANIEIQKVEIEKANVKIAEITGKIAVINTELVRLRADTPNLAKNRLTIDKYVSAVRSYEAAIRAYTAVAKQGGRSEAAREEALAQYQNTKDEIDNSLDLAEIICTKGF